MLVMAVLLGVGVRLSSPSFESARVTGRVTDRRGIKKRLVAAGATSRVTEDYLANFAGNCAMIPSLSMSAMCRIWTWISS